jgi:hypothetical protein
MLSSFHASTLKELFSAICNNALPSRAGSMPFFSACKASSTAFATFAKDASFSNIATNALWLRIFLRRMYSGKITSAGYLLITVMTKQWTYQGQAVQLVGLQEEVPSRLQVSNNHKDKRKWYNDAEMLDLHKDP